MPLVINDKITSKIPPLSNETLNHFLSFCKKRKFPKKGVVFREGDPANNFYYILDGSVSVTSVDEDGSEIVFTYLHAGEFIGEVGLFILHSERSAMVRARTEVELAEISYEQFELLTKNELREQHAEILNAVGFQISARLLKTSARISLLTSTDVAGRIAKTLLDLCQEPNALSHPEGTQIHISRQEIGRIVSCSRETVGRVLKQMTIDGMIEVKGMDIVVYHSR
ncbi:MAG: cyclic nucleotide-binding domain-containing protein [Gammaproteobacteria bacterium]|nr:cyclic nucleotide-binding domain-containing protein [Gammaproteobacteria bacterium]MCW8987920.1 cyclic nucleotide-binding domain-containing protein [Gammaproteobacteria bacterium]MCW9029972.1 cyclic nucleotide-binding domain-containing protein [Gammaproteobacteria bacterium]